MSKYFKANHYTELTLAEAAEWELIAPSFMPKELASKGNGSLLISKESLRKLQRLRHTYGGPLKINSAYRDPEHNRKVGGGSSSQHVQGRAFDIHITDSEMGRKLERLAIECEFTAIGRYRTFIHVDDRPPKSNGGGYRWGKWS
jgi:uncharacterized protein YcbK (DUF882 family)